MRGFLQRAHNGEVIVVTARDKQVAEIHPPAEWVQPARRKPGALKGRITIGPDFNSLPEELVEAFEG